MKKKHICKRQQKESQVYIVDENKKLKRGHLNKNDKDNYCDTADRRKHSISLRLQSNVCS